jgi:hypothetical protein
MNPVPDQPLQESLTREIPPRLWECFLDELKSRCRELTSPGCTVRSSPRVKLVVLFRFWGAPENWKR